MGTDGNREGWVRDKNEGKVSRADNKRWVYHRDSVFRDWMGLWKRLPEGRTIRPKSQIPNMALYSEERSMRQKLDSFMIEAGCDGLRGMWPSINVPLARIVLVNRISQRNIRPKKLMSAFDQTMACVIIPT